MKKNLRTIIFILILLLAKSCIKTTLAENLDQPVPTQITVHILAHGAKAMYPRLGAKVIIRDARTNEILDEGEVQGGSGDTAALMKAGYPRTLGKYGLTRNDTGMIAVDHSPEANDRLLLLSPENLMDKNVGAEPYQPKSDAAKFVGTIQISEPTVIQIEAIGPLNHTQATMSDSITTLILPGRNISGEGIVLNLRGLVVDILTPEKHKDAAVPRDKSVRVTFNMSMMCGCPVFDKPDNPWKTKMFTFPIQAYYDGKLYYEKEFAAGEIITDVSTFEFLLPLPEKIHKKKTEIKLRIMAAQPELANYGMDEVSFHVQ